MRAPLHAALVTSFAIAGVARAGLTGSAEVQAFASGISTTQPNGEVAGTSTALLQENLSLHYAGLPFGPTVALLALGGSLTNVNGSFSGRTATLDASVGLLPRRAYPLRLYARLTGGLGGPGGFAGAGAGPSVLYGASFNLEPGLLPGLRFDVQETRATGIAQVLLGDLRRTLIAGAYQSYGDQQLNLSARVDRDERTPSLGAAPLQLDTQQYLFSWASPRHFTSASVAVIDRPEPNFARILRERTATASHAQRFGDSLQADLGATVGDATSGTGRGERATGRASLEWTPLRTEQLSLGVSGEGGLARTEGDLGSGRGQSHGGSLHAGYARPLGPVQAGVRLAAATSYCRCDFGNQGQSTSLDFGLSAVTLSLLGVNLRGEYSIAKVFAPLQRGGDRLEQHVRASAQARLYNRIDLALTAGYDDGDRELFDIQSGAAYVLHEQALTGSLGASTLVGSVAVAAEVRHARGSAVAPAAPFVSGEPISARAITSAQLSASAPVLYLVDVRGLLLGSWTELLGSPPLSSLGAQVGASCRLGMLTMTLDYQVLRTTLGAESTTLNHSVRGTLARPFEL